MSEDSSEKKERLRWARANFFPDQLKKFLRGEVQKDNELFSQVSRHHKDYIDAIGLDKVDLESLEEKQGHLGMYPRADDFIESALLRFEIEGEKFALFSKHTACHDYGNSYGWENLLMAVARNKGLNKETGNGTSWIISVPEEWHTKILETIKNSSQRDGLSGELFSFLK